MSAGSINGVILTIGTQDDGSSAGWFWLQADQNIPNLPSCHTVPADRVAWDFSRAVSKSAFALATSAYLTNRRVVIDTYDTCHNGYVTVRNIYFSK